MNYTSQKVFAQLFKTSSDDIMLKELYRLVNLGPAVTERMKLVDFFERIHSDREAADIELPEVRDEEQVVDMRVCRFWLKNFRGFGVGPQNEAYGFDLCLDDECGKTPCSMVLLGHNGCGKTSLYSAMELTFTGSTSIIRKRLSSSSDKESEIKNFYRNVYASAPCEITVDTVSGQFIYDGRPGVDLPLAPYGMPATPFFCSESDIALFELGNEDFASYYSSQLGLASVNAAIDMCSTLVKDIEEHINGINKRKEELQAIIREKDETDDGGQEPSNEESMGQIWQELDSLNNRAMFLGEISENADSMKMGLEEAVNTEMNDSLAEAQDILKALLIDTKFWKKEETLAFDSGKGDRKLFNGKISVGDERPEQTPRILFNNFRFKLYLISIRIAIAFNLMRRGGINFPLFFDDVFEACDFVNRSNGVKNFIIHVFQKHYDIFHGSQPLQIIFFTQDEVVAESVYDGINACCSGRPDMKRPRVALGKLFAADDAGEGDVRESQGECFYQLCDIIRKNY